MGKRKVILISIVSIVALITLIAGIFFMARKVNAVRDDVEVKIADATIIAGVARTDAEQEKGLGGYAEIGMQEGMQFPFEEPTWPTFWMKDMLFPIDIVWVSEGKVLGVVENIDPQIGAQEDELKLYDPPDFIDSALELHAGAVKKFNIKVGDEVVTRVLDSSSTQP